MLDQKIGFSGKMTAGKTTIANLLAEKYGYLVLPIGGRIKKVCNLLLEDEIKLLAYLENILPKETLTKNSNPIETTFHQISTLYNKDFLPIIHKHGVHNVFIKDGHGVYQKNQYYRDLTQKVGSSVRKIFGEDIWVKILANEANHLISKGEKVICDDIRLEDEYNLFTDQGYTLFRLDVEKEEQKKRILELYKNYNEEALVHHTEIALDNFDFKHRFNTTFDSVDQTFSKVESIIKGVNND